MTRKDFLRSISAAAVASPAMAGKAKRNLVVILSDDHSYNTMGCAGHPWLKTPGLDRMANGGALFSNAFVTTSLCSPSRASIMTGQYAHAHRVLDNSTPFSKDAVVSPELLRRNGYRTAFMGKWHMGAEGERPQAGFERWISFRGQGVYNDPALSFDGQQEKRTGYLTDILTQEALKFIHGSKANPFCLFLSHKAVHGFCEPAPRHNDLYSTEPIPYPRSMANTDETYRGKPEWVRRQRNSWHGVDGMYNQRISFDKNYRDYCKTLMALDESVGAVLSGLEDNGLLQSTLVIYLSDNGFQFGEHGLIDKRTMYESSIRIPMLAHCPDLFEKGQRVRGMALNIDIAPTLLDAGGVPASPAMHGRSLLPLLRRQGEWRKDFLYEYFWERAYPQTPSILGLRTDNHSYMNYHGIWDRDELYDIQSDPEQMNNLLADYVILNQGGPVTAQIKQPETRTLVQGFQTRIRQTMAATGGRSEPSWAAHCLRVECCGPKRQYHP